MPFTPDQIARHSVILLTGDEEILRRRALDEVLDVAGIARDDFELEQFEADAATPADWFASVSTSPFLAPRRTAIVRHLLRREPDAAAAAGLATVPDTGLLILVADDEGGGDPQRWARIRTAWEKSATTAKALVVKFNADPKAAKDGLRTELLRLGKKMGDRAIETLIEMTGGSLSRGVDELQKVALFVGEAPQIQESDVRAVVVPSREWNVFRLVDTVMTGEIAEALRQLRILVGGSGKAEEAAFRQILPQISRTLRLVWQARLCLDAGCDPANPTDAVRAMFPEKPNLSKESSYRQRQVVALARRVRLAQVAACFQILSDTDARLKGALTGYNGIDTLERMVLEMAETLSNRVVAAR